MKQNMMNDLPGIFVPLESRANVGLEHSPLVSLAQVGLAHMSANSSSALVLVALLSSIQIRLKQLISTVLLPPLVKMRCVVNRRCRPLRPMREKLAGQQSLKQFKERCLIAKQRHPFNQSMLFLDVPIRSPAASSSID